MSFLLFIGTCLFLSLRSSPFSHSFSKAVQRGVKKGSKMIAGHSLADPEQDKKEKENLETYKMQMSLEYGLGNIKSMHVLSLFFFRFSFFFC
jgi:hypothetical protein